MIFMPFPRFVAPISNPPPLAITKVASMKHSFPFSAPLSRSSLATSVSTRRKPHRGTKSESADARFVVWVTLRQHVPLRACVENPQDRFEHTTRWSRFANVHRQYSPPENDPGCVPTARPVSRIIRHLYRIDSSR